MITIAVTKFSEPHRKIVFWVAYLQMSVNDCLVEFFFIKFASTFSINCPYILIYVLVIIQNSLKIILAIDFKRM